jgi:hypothetical protein
LNKDTSGGVKIIARLYDKNNNEISLSGKTVTWGSVEGSSENLTIDSNISDSNNTVTKANNNVTMNDLFIVKAEVTYGYKLTAYLPIPISSPHTDTSGNVYTVDYIKGATRVLYSTSGEPDYSREPYSIEWKNNKGLSSGTWQIYPNKKTSEEASYIPNLKDNIL